ncbi:hypothetical protein M6B38_400500 [Iris pallida]|uniref:Uncharacterized protein n=1 Tax=Iris pallida TaxID=29817 RepID=A0AAX6FTW7_IRIPA|nr:hypothetical protein M6B38_400500 [Iris pallida]
MGIVISEFSLLTSSWAGFALFLERVCFTPFRILIFSICFGIGWTMYINGPGIE